MNNHEATLMSLSQSHAKSNEEEMLSTFVTDSYTRIFNESKYFLSKFTRFTSSKSITHNILFSN